jgi:hypothetical protein
MLRVTCFFQLQLHHVSASILPRVAGRRSSGFSRPTSRVLVSQRHGCRTIVGRNATETWLSVWLAAETFYRQWLRKPVNKGPVAHRRLCLSTKPAQQRRFGWLSGGFRKFRSGPQILARLRRAPQGCKAGEMPQFPDAPRRASSAVGSERR